MKRNPEFKGKWYAEYIDNPAYKGEWSPRQIDNPDFFEDLNPVKKLNKIGGVGIELWTMTEDILFDNIYVGHSLADAKALAEESFAIKHAFEEAEAKKAAIKDEDTDAVASFKAAPVDFIRSKVFKFIDLAKLDPVLAFKSAPETGAGLILAAITLFGMLGALFGIVGGAQKPVVKSSKKTDAVTADDKKTTQVAPVAPAGGDAKDDSTIKKRK